MTNNSTTVQVSDTTMLNKEQMPVTKKYYKFFIISSANSLVLTNVASFIRL